MKKIFLLGLLLLCGICFADEEKFVVAKPGATLELYTASLRKVRPDTAPIAVVVDFGKQFCHDNITLIKEVAKYRQQLLFKVWKGYVTIPADGDYVVSMSYNRYDKWGTMGPNTSNTILEIGGKTIMYITQLPQKGAPPQIAATEGLRLSEGSYEFKIIHRSGFKNDIFTLKMWNKKSPLKKTIITPADMAYVE